MNKLPSSSPDRGAPFRPSRSEVRQLMRPKDAPLKRVGVRPHIAGASAKSNTLGTMAAAIAAAALSHAGCMIPLSDCTDGKKCKVGTGVCAQEGHEICADEATYETACGAEPLLPTELEETSCDGLDNDCDGHTDEGLLDENGLCRVPLPDAGVPDTEIPDAGAPDVGAPDVGTLDDAGAPDDAETLDSETPDFDSGTDTSDAGSDAGQPPDAAEDTGMSNDTGNPGDTGIDAADTGDADANDTDASDTGVAEPEVGQDDGGEPCQPTETPEVSCDGIDNDCDGRTDIDDSGRILSQDCASPVCAVEGKEFCNDGEYSLCTAQDPDIDGDRIPDCMDNCPDTSNPDQQDADQSGTGDACEDHMGRLSCVNHDQSSPDFVVRQAPNARYINVFLTDKCGNVTVDPKDGVHSPVFAHNIGTNPVAHEAGARVRADITPNVPVSGCVSNTDGTPATMIPGDPSSDCWSLSFQPQ